MEHQQRRRANPRRHHVSVSSNGSIGVELGRPDSRPLNVVVFQYPLTDRLGWNPNARLVRHRFLDCFSIL